MIDWNKFIEGYLTGIAVDRKEKKVCLSLKEVVSGQNWVLTVSDVAELMVLQMCMQNIIERVLIWDSSNDDKEYRDQLYSLVTGKLGEDDKTHRPIIEAIVQSIKRGEVFLLEIEPVYGAYVLILAKDMFIVEVE